MNGNFTRQGWKASVNEFSRLNYVDQFSRRAGFTKKHLLILTAIIILSLAGKPAVAQTQVIVRDTGGLPGIRNSCGVVGCTVNYGLDGKQGQLFLVTPTQTTCSGLSGCVLTAAFNLLNFIAELLLQPGVTDAEPDQLLKVSGLTAPSGLSDNTPVKYYGNTVWDGYVHQRAAYIVNLPDEQSSFTNITGAGTVAVIDTGIDPTHPAFNGVLVSGYDFTRNITGGSELADVNQSTMAVVNG